MAASDPGAGERSRSSEARCGAAGAIVFAGCPGQSVLFQGDPEPSIRQVINACEACRSRVGLATEKRWVPRGSHASNEQAERAIQTIRTNGLTDPQILCGSKD